MDGLDLEMLLSPDEDFSDPAKRQATAAALRRQYNMGTLGQLMGTQPTVAAGSAMQERAGGSLRSALAKQQAQKEAAARAEERRQAQMNADRQFNEQRRQFGVQEGRLAAAQSQEAKKQWAAAVDPITGAVRLYNQFTGEWKDTDQPQGQPGAQPQFNPQLGMKPTEKMKNDITSIQQQRGAISGALGAVQQRPGAFGVSPINLAEQFGGPIGAALAGWARNPQDTQARSFVLNNVSTIINERAGAAQSVQELARLRGFLPNETDSPEKVTAKFNAFLDYLDEREAATRGYSTEQLGMKPRGGALDQSPWQAGSTPQAQGASPPPQAARPGDKYLTGGQ